jgi:chromosome segregation ATPase
MAFLKKSSSHRQSMGKESKLKPPRKSIFRRPRTATSSLQYITWSSSEGTSFDSADSRAILPALTESSHGTDESSRDIQDIESLKQSHAEEIAQMKEEISKLQEANEELKLEKETSEHVMLQQETEIIKKDYEIKRLNDKIGESSETSPQTNEYEGKYKASQDIIRQQEMEIITKADETSYLKNSLHAQELRHEAETMTLQTTVLEKEQEIELLKERLTVTSELVSQTANMLLLPKKQTGIAENTSWTLNIFDIL